MSNEAVWLFFSSHSTVMADSKVKFEETGNGDRTVRKWKNKLKKSKCFVRKHIFEQAQ
jgi:hypothetical protein